MQNILLIIVAAFLILMAFSGYRKGGLKILLSVAALVITLVAASYLTPTVTKYIKDHTPLYDKIYGQMETFVGQKLENENESSGQQKALGSLPLPSSVTDVLVQNNNQESYGKLGVSSFASYTAQSLTIILLNAISYIGLFIVISIIFRMIIIAADIIGRLPVINGFNRLAGTILGICQGVLILWVLCIALTAISGTSFGQQIFTMVNGSVFLSFLYNNNMLLDIITGIFKAF